ncbi:MAG: hypothetical protein V4813_10975 [Gemmatimonadota bacterium]
MTSSFDSSSSLGVTVFHRRDRLLLQFTGPKAAESLTGLVTNDVLALRGGDGLYACALTPKGRIIADVRILAIADDAGAVTTLLADTNAAAGTGFSAMIRKYVNPRTAKYTDLSVVTTCLTLAGDGALALLATLGADESLLAPLASGNPFTHRELSLGGTVVRAVRIPDLGETTALDLHVAAADAEALQQRLRDSGATEGDMLEWHRRRVLADRPEWGVDMDEGTLAQEANMDALQAISYKKGCYTGQETVARVHFRGHVNRTLRRVRYDGDALPAVGTALLGPEDAAVGDARSSAMVDAGSGVGIAMLRREVGDAATLRWLDANGTAHTATVVGAAAEA